MKNIWNITSICILLITLLIGCKQISKENSIINDFKSCGITEITTSIDPRSFITEKLTIELDTPFLSNISSVKIFKEELYLFDAIAGSVFIYDFEGNFKRTIGRQGRGPGELLSAKDFVIDPTTEIVEILNSSTQSIKKFSTDSQFLYEVQLEESYGSFFKFSNDTYLFKRPIVNFTPHFAIEPDENYSFFYGKIDKGIRFMPFRPQQLAHGDFSYTRNCFSEFDNGVLYWEIFNDTIYHIVEGNVEFKYHVDFKGKSIPFEILVKPLNELLSILNSEENIEKYAGMINDVIGFNDWIIFSYVSNAKLHYIYWNINQDNVKSIDAAFFNNNSLFKVSENKFVCVGFHNDSDLVKLTLFEII